MISVSISGAPTTSIRISQLDTTEIAGPSAVGAARFTSPASAMLGSRVSSQVLKTLPKGASGRVR